MRRFAWVVLGSLAIVAPVAGQSGGIDKGTVEIGAFVRADRYTTAYSVHGATWDYMGLGGRFGYFVVRKLALELDGSYNQTDLTINQPNIPLTNGRLFERLNYIPFHLQLVYNAPLSEHVSWEIGGGGSYHKLTGGITRGDVGVGGITGLRWRASNRLNFRLEGLGDYVPSGFGPTNNTYLAAQLGISLMLGGKGCDHAGDMVSIRPTSAHLNPGQTQGFSSTATYCAEPDQVVYRLTGPGKLDSISGLYTATTVGTAQVTAYSRKGKMTSAAAITVAAPAPAAPPPPPAARPAPPPAPRPAPPPHYNFDLAMVHFRFDHADLTKGGQDSVKAIAETLKTHGEVSVDVVGHTDWIGTAAYNMKLSRARAETVRRLLVDLGIADSRITVKWRGKEEPMADNKIKAGRDMNRRVEVKQNN
jgi:outer membrane protein OmpA-like peptidoglycan-associated protein